MSDDGRHLNGTPSVPQGATAVVPLDNAVAVVSTNTWAAIQASRQMSASWNNPPNAALLDSNVFATQAKHLLGRGAPYIADQRGNVNAAFDSAARVLEMTYTLPYLPHACMEVLNCTVRMTPPTGTPTACEIWAPTQSPNFVLSTAAAVTGLPNSAITIHPMFMGGGLGRKFEQDYISQAIRTAMAVGQPVKLTWPREEDFSRDQYRPMAVSRVRVALDAYGKHHGVGESACFAFHLRAARATAPANR